MFRSEALEPRRMLADLAAGFADSTVTASLTRPTQMAFTPDGRRLLVAEQAGRLRVVRDGALLSTPAITLSVANSGEQGFGGVVADPDFTTNGHVYLYYTRPGVNGGSPYNRLSRFTMSGDVITPASERVLMDLEPLTTAFHMGGGLRFGPDGKLYVAVGDNARPSLAQSRSITLGKMLRLNRDGTIPADNPFYGSTSGNARAIYATGLRNPFTFAVRPASATTAPQLFINDVGQSSWEEVNRGGRGDNFGWPATEGPTTNTAYRPPLHAYSHADGRKCVIGADFYPSSGGTLPGQFAGKFLFGDHIVGFIKALDPGTGQVVGTISRGGIAAMTDLDVGRDGAIYYLQRTADGGGRVGRIRYVGIGPPAITDQPDGRTVERGRPVTFSVAATGQSPLSFQWQRNGANIAGATSSTYAIASVADADNGARFRAIVRNALGSAASGEVILTVIAPNVRPVPTISAPSSTLRYKAGDTISFSGSATDPQQGALGASSLTWTIDFHHADHAHPFRAPVSGIAAGSFVVPASGETSADVWYRIYLKATDRDGNTATTYRDVFPQKSSISVGTSVAGLQVKLDDQPRAAPFSFQNVANLPRTLSAVSPQTLNGVGYVFTGWSDGSTGATRTIRTSAAAASYTANFVPASAVRTIRSVADTYVRGGSLAGRSFGTSGELHVKRSGNSEYERVTYLKFDLSTIASVGTAKLRLYGRTNQSGGSVGVEVLGAGNTTWTEGTTWNTRPAASTPVLGRATVSGTTNRWIEVDVTAYLKERKAAGVKHVTLVLRGAAESSAYATFASRDSGINRPELRIT